MQFQDSSVACESRAHLWRRWLHIAAILASTVLDSAQGSSLTAQTATSPQTESRKTSTPYVGDLSVFEETDRDKKLQIQRVMDILRIHAGSNVSDIGAGSGWFTVRAAKRVGEDGLVYAVDINPESIKYIEERKKKEAIHNVRTILSAPDDPKLPEKSVDSVLILKTYHEVANPVLLLQNLRKSLRTGARIGIIDRNGNGEDHGIDKEVVVKEAGQAGYHLTDQYDFVKSDRVDYFLVFETDSTHP